MNIHLPDKVDFRHEFCDDFFAFCHHPLTVFKGIFQGKVHIPEIVVSILLLYRKERQIAARKRSIKAFAKFHCFFLIKFFDAFSEIAAAGMDHQPDEPIVTFLDFNKVVSAAERTEIVPVKFGDKLSIHTFCIEIFFKSIPLLTIFVHLPFAYRDQFFDARMDRTAETHIFQFFCGDIGFHCDHPAADIHSDSTWDHCIFCGDHSADRHTDTAVTVRHQSHMMTQRRMPGKIFGLSHCCRFHISAPAFDMNRESFIFYKFHFSILSFYFLCKVYFSV